MKETNSQEQPWAEEPTPQCDSLVARCAGAPVWHAKARDLERRLRYAAKIVDRLRADSDCGDFGTEDLDKRLDELKEALLL